MPRIGQPGRYEFEYIRRGTRSLIAAFNPHTGEVFGRCSRRRKAADLLRFMEAVAERYPHKRITIVWDNLNIHSGPGGRRSIVATAIAFASSTRRSTRPG